MEEAEGLLHFFQKVRAKKGSQLHGQFEMMTAKSSIVLQCLRDREIDWDAVSDYMTDATDLADDLLDDPC